ncbi:MAG TPA: hypothetical protein VNM14_13090 [Planctomycetota bacterium]|nr:hypothetical protein [Planctomycetota bacterium]
MIYIRSKAEALDAVAAVLALPERRQQIVQLTVRVAMCLDPEARRFLADCQAGLIEGGLEYMKKRRHDLLASRQEEAPEAIVIVDSSEDQLLEQVGVALDALRLSEIVRQVFPAVRERHDPWEIARAFLADEAELRKVMIEAVRAHGAGNSEVYERARQDVQRRIAAAAPPWVDDLSLLAKACEVASPGEPQLLAVVAVDDMRAKLVIDLLQTSKAEALEYLRGVTTRIEQLRRLEAESK